MSYEALPNDAMVPTTEEVAFFELPAAAFSTWLIAELGPQWVQREVGCESGQILGTLDRHPDVGIDRYLLFSSSGWTAVLNNSKLGTDMGMIPSIAARRLECMAIRAVTAEDRKDSYGATILEVFDPTGTLPLRRRRTISAANNGGGWRFDQSGEPFSFEDEASYSLRRIRDRFTPALLYRYLDCLNVPIFLTDSLTDYSPVLLERQM